jgi:hypothetical protein
MHDLQVIEIAFLCITLVSEQLMLHMNNQAHKKAAGGSIQETKNMLI